MAGYFITGTDTGVGKTYVTCLMLRALRTAGLGAVGYKPVAAGSEHTPEGLRNEDALRLMAAAGGVAGYEAVNPVALEPAIAPHLAAEQAGVAIHLEELVAGCHRLEAAFDCVLTEGAGGWLVPISRHETLADLAVALGHPVILVVGMRLGCLNHALLTARAITDRGLTLAGWVANRIDPEMPFADANVDTLKPLLPAPLLATVEYGTHLWPGSLDLFGC